jgi:hypothetical protein
MSFEFELSILGMIIFIIFILFAVTKKGTEMDSTVYWRLQKEQQLMRACNKDKDESGAWI